MVREGWKLLFGIMLMLNEKHIDPCIQVTLCEYLIIINKSLLETQNIQRKKGSEGNKIENQINILGK